MKQSELKKIIKEETAKVLKEKLNFVLGPTIHGDPNKPMKDDFKIAFKDPRKAIMTIMKVNDDLKARGLEPVDYENVGIVFNKPSNQQMQAILNAFNNEDVESVGRVLREGKLNEGLDQDAVPFYSAKPSRKAEFMTFYKNTPILKDMLVAWDTKGWDEEKIAKMLIKQAPDVVQKMKELTSFFNFLNEAHPVGSLGRDMSTTPNPNISRAEYEADVKFYAQKALEFEKLKKSFENRLNRTKNPDHRETLEGEIEFTQDQIDTYKGMVYDLQRIIKNIK